MSTKDFYQAVGAPGLKQIARDFNIKEDLTFVLGACNKGDNLLDLGCGYGRVAIPLAEHGYKVTGIDQSQKLVSTAIEAANQAGVHTVFDVGTITALPYKDEVFNKVFCLWNVFNELTRRDEQVATLQEALRVLAPHGSAYFFLLNEERAGSLTNAVRKFFEILHLSGARPRHTNNEHGTWIRTSTLFGETLLQYMHTRESLCALIDEVNCSTYKIEFFLLDKKRRMLLTLQK